MPSSTAASTSVNPLQSSRLHVAQLSYVARGSDDPAADVSASRADADRVHAENDWRLHKHADYQRVYQGSRKQFSALMSYFAATQPAERAGVGPRVGITAGKVLGKAVDRNRIKRRMRAAIVSNLEVLDVRADVVLHPKRSVLDAEWKALDAEVRRVFLKIQASFTAKTQSAGTGSAREPGA